MNYRNDLSCKRKVAYDMESAAARWDTHPGNSMYICTTCGFVHFSSNNVPIMDRLHERALAMYQRTQLSQHLSRPAIRKPAFVRRVPNHYAADTSCRISVWNASKVSIGELLSLSAKSPVSSDSRATVL